MASGSTRVVAVLGPTNTGKTHYAIARMLGYRTGIIGLPLRLLAREVYERIAAHAGLSAVGLVTGEERIVPSRCRYWVCTVEAMPVGKKTEFVAVDEIQLCADPERGHVFTGRLLRSRGSLETLFLGSDTIRGPISALVPEAEFVSRERMSRLTYAGSRKLSRIPRRSAIVGFTVDSVYTLAELVRRQKGGAAVVTGALSPRTRNAQVALYQNGDVDYLVATDAIGMGLNLDIAHVAFSSLTKFDGGQVRPLVPSEFAQIAGRAGRGMADGTFGVTGDASHLDDRVVQAIENHRFTPLNRINWRNPDLRFDSIQALITSLEEMPRGKFLAKAREADDLATLKALATSADVSIRTTDRESVRLLWDVCRIPDFPGISAMEHAGLVGTIYLRLRENGTISEDWMARQVRRIDRTDGDIDVLSKRLAFVRTWTYVSQCQGWLVNEDHWRAETRAVEDRLSDALHVRLTKRFIDRRTSVLQRRLMQKETLLTELNDAGELTVEGQFVGRLEGFRFSLDGKVAAGAEAKAVGSAALKALVPKLQSRAIRFYNAFDTELRISGQGRLMWGECAVGRLASGQSTLRPRIEIFVDDAAGPEAAEKVERRLRHFVDRQVSGLLGPLLELDRDTEITGLARGIAFRMVEALGCLPRAGVAQEIRELDQEVRGRLRKHGIRFGQYTVFMPQLLKPKPTRLRVILWSLAKGIELIPDPPEPGLVTIPVCPKTPEGYYDLCGYRALGAYAIRVDMLERVADLIREQDGQAGFEASEGMLSLTGMTQDGFAALMRGLGYRAERGERARPVQTPAVDGITPGTDQTSGHFEASGLEETNGTTGQEMKPAVSGASTVAETSDGDTDQEIRVFYTFTKGGRRNGGKENRLPGGPKRKGGQGRSGDRPEHGGADGSLLRRTGKAESARSHRSREREQAKTNRSAMPPRRKVEKIDPLNPFAVALKGLRDGH